MLSLGKAQLCPVVHLQSLEVLRPYAIHSPGLPLSLARAAPLPPLSTYKFLPLAPPKRV